MQFLENSVIGLRSARHRLRSKEHAPEVTLFPMVHVGEEAFYAQVYKDAAKHDVILLEGVESKIVTNLTRAYRWIKPTRLGLVIQPKFELETQGDVVRSDLTGEEFDALWRKVPAVQRRIFSVLSPVFGVVRGLTLTRARLAKGMDMDDLATRDDVLGWADPYQPLRHALHDARDARLCEHLERAILSHAGTPAKIAVVYGAAHMPAVLRFLQGLGGYVPVDSDWLTVFSS